MTKKQRDIANEILKGTKIEDIDCSKKDLAKIIFDLAKTLQEFEETERLKVEMEKD